jgi:PHD/YefM family antitoxin component YafN of YafNO toxin-antitoxin module
MQIYTPSNFRKNLFELLGQVADNNEKMEITIKQPTGPNKEVILMSKERYERLE